LNYVIQSASSRNYGIGRNVYVMFAVVAT